MRGSDCAAAVAAERPAEAQLYEAVATGAKAQFQLVPFVHCCEALASSCGRSTGGATIFFVRLLLFRTSIYLEVSFIYGLLGARSGPEMGPVLVCVIDACGNGCRAVGL